MPEKKTLERAKTISARGRLHPRKPENLFAKRWITCGKGSTQPVPPNKRLRLVCPKPGALA